MAHRGGGGGEAGMRAVTHKAQNNKYLFSLIKKKAGAANQIATSPDLLHGRGCRA